MRKTFYIGCVQGIGARVKVRNEKEPRGTKSGVTTTV
jgi:hypothetical protein